MDTEEKLYLNEKEVSQITGISLATLRSNRVYGIGMPYYKVGKSVRYKRDEVIAYVEKNRVG